MKIPFWSVQISLIWYKGNYVTCSLTLQFEIISWIVFTLVKIHTKKELQVIQATWFSFPVEPAAVVFLLSVYESLAPLGRWHCPIFPLSVCLSICFSHSACFSAACTLSFWTMTLRDSCNVRRLAILAGALESWGSREGEGLYLRRGALTSLITLFFFLLFFFLLLSYSLCLLP